MTPVQQPAGPSVVQTTPVVSPGVSVSNDPAANDPKSTSGNACPRLDLKVLHIVNGEHFSGAERVQSHLGRCLRQSGVEADFVSIKPGKFADMLDLAENQWGKGHRFAMRGRFDFSVVKQIQHLVRSQKYEILHAHTPRTAMVTSVVSRLTGTPWIYHVHSPAARDSSRKLLNRINALIERMSLRNCDHLITVSESLRMDCLNSGVREDRVSVVQNGVPAIRPTRLGTPVPGERWIIGMIALMRPRKGLEIAIDAIARLRDANHDAVLRIIGPFETDEYRQSILKQIDDRKIADQIERVGFTNDVPSELAKLDAMVLPSLFGEGLPMVVLESMAAGVPVVATRVEGTPEAVTDGVEGLLAEPRDSQSLADAITQLVTGQVDWETMSETAVQTHARKFSDKAMAAKTAKVYRRLLSSR